MIQIYIDAEFDAIKAHGKFYQSVISFGAVMADRKGNYIDTFYTLSRPKQFQRLSPVVKRITGLRDEDILHAPRFSEMVESFVLWIKKYADVNDVVMYAFGPDDRRTLMGENARGELKFEKLFDGIQDLQQEISTHTFFHNKMLSSTLSLEDAKGLYQIKGRVKHNALTDATDLYHLHRAYLAKDLDLGAAQELYKKMEEKEQIEDAKRLVAFQRKLMREFRHDLHEVRELVLFKPSIGTLTEWSKNDLQLTTFRGKEIREGQKLKFSIQREGESTYFILTLSEDVGEICKRCMITAKNREYINALLEQWKLSQLSFQDEGVYCIA